MHRLSVIALAGLVSACNPVTPITHGGGPNGGPTTNPSGNGGGAGSGGGVGGGGSNGPGGGAACSNMPANGDTDGDGYTPAQGDCNDCDPNMNPGAIEIAGDGKDNDCDGMVDETEAACDQ